MREAVGQRRWIDTLPLIIYEGKLVCGKSAPLLAQVHCEGMNPVVLTCESAGQLYRRDGPHLWCLLGDPLASAFLRYSVS